MNKKNLSFSFILFFISVFSTYQISYADTKTSISVPEYGTGINKSWNNKFCVGFVKVTKNGISLGETQMKVLGSRNTYREKGSLLIILPLIDFYIESEIPAKHIVQMKYAEFSIHSILNKENSDKTIIFKTSDFRYERSSLHIEATITIDEDVYTIKGTLTHDPKMRE
ncbi:hypothetical protein [uncultured Brachyspira sp.]|uniref:hypothetical protein n=1 Tax=uncultured Brachyspira sp. TaxID=221953 RepID=UPI0026191BE4|nr:hypothetical protein [uncultured Brachyspira sp.]